MINREEILKTLKGLITDIQHNGKKFKTDKAFREEWQKKQQEVGIAVKSLNSCDMLWLSEEYAVWFNVNVKSSMKDIDTSIKLNWK